MGMQYSAAIIVGLPRDELLDHEDFDDFENGTLAAAPPYYDGYQDAIFGITVVQSGDYSAMEITNNLDVQITIAKQAFKEKTGLDGKVYITPVGW